VSQPSEDSGLPDLAKIGAANVPDPVEVPHRGEMFRWSGFGSDSEILGVVRGELAGWVHASGRPGDTTQDILLATYEALANALEHAYPHRMAPADLTVDLTATYLDDGGMQVIVRDYGRWREPASDPGFRGRGLRLIRGLADRTELTCGDQGSTVRMWWLPRTD
jgi:serine/threonine-protein kinase RsbW